MRSKIACPGRRHEVRFALEEKPLDLVRKEVELKPDFEDREAFFFLRIVLVIS